MTMVHVFMIMIMIQGPKQSRTDIADSGKMKRELKQSQPR